MTTRTATWIVGGVLTLGLAAAAWAVTGINGWTVTPVFTWDAATQAGVVYPTGYTGRLWSSFSRTGIGGWAGAWPTSSVTANAAGGIYFIASGNNPEPLGGGSYTVWPWFNGVLAYDGTTCRQLVQNASASEEGSSYAAITTSPVTSGRLVAGCPVVMRQRWSGGFRMNPVSEVVAIDATASPPVEWVLYQQAGPGPLAPLQEAVVANDGRIYVLDRETSRIVRLTWNGSSSSYVADTLPTSLVPGNFLQIAPDGFLFTGKASQIWWSTGRYDAARSICRLNPVTGAWSVYSTVPKGLDAQEQVCDSGGAFRVAVHDTSKAKPSDPKWGISTAAAGGTACVVKYGIATTTTFARLGKGPNGVVYVVGEDTFDSILALRP